MRLIITFDNLTPEQTQGIVAAVRNSPAGCGSPVVQLETNDDETLAEILKTAPRLNRVLWITPHHETR